MKRILPWIVAVLALAGAVFLYQSDQSKSADVARLQQENQELAGLRAEVEELKKNQVPAEELTRLRKNTEELIRLRNSVRQLSAATNQLSKEAQSALTQAQRAQNQAQAAQAAQEAQAQALAQAQAAAQQGRIPTIDSNTLANMTPQQREAYAALAQRYGTEAATPEAQAKSQINSCVNNLRQIDGAKQQWALENAKNAQAVPSAQEIAPYLKGNILPRCPGGGVYTINSLEVSPTCSMPGHVLQ